ncbi:unnamed protein product, partial [marine sediment metagenome]
MSGLYKGYMDRVVPLIIEKSDKLAHSDLNDTEKKLHSLIMVVFSFSANAIDKLDEQTKTDMKADAVEILWEDDEGNEHVEKIAVGDTKEVGSRLTWLHTV